MRRRPNPRRMPAVAVLCAVLLVIPSARASGTLVLGAAFTGSISPPLDATPRLNTQTIREVVLQYAGTVGSKPVEGFGLCLGSTRSLIPETITTGFGTGSFACDTFDDLNGGGTLTCSFTYARTGAAYRVPGMTCSFTGLAPGQVTGSCAFAYMPLGFPASSYASQGLCTFL